MKARRGGRLSFGRTKAAARLDVRAIATELHARRLRAGTTCGGYIMPNDPPFREVSLYVEQEGTNKFKIQSNQLEQIGAQLRGPREFSIFQSIILPLIVTIATLIFTSLFQYVSWYNSVNLQNATDVAANAERAYEKSAAEIGKRQYAMLVFLPSLRELVKDAKTIVEANAKASVEATGKTSVKNRKTAERSPLSAFASAPFEIPLHKSDLDIKQQRFASYYKQLKAWNENYDHLLTDIDYAIDRPVFKQAGKQSERVLYGQFHQIKCSTSLTEELERLHLNPDSLKLRFAGINKCFIDTSQALSQLLTEAISATLPTFNDSTESIINANLDSLHSKANAFRCYALHRIDYYKAQKELSILSISYSWRWLNDAQKTEAQNHFEETAKSCNE